MSKKQAKFYLTEEAHRRLQRAAERSGVSMSAAVEDLIRRHVTSEGADAVRQFIEQVAQTQIAEPEPEPEQEAETGHSEKDSDHDVFDPIDI